MRVQRRNQSQKNAQLAEHLSFSFPGCTQEVWKLSRVLDFQVTKQTS
jgi:hypothetical protein